MAVSAPSLNEQWLWLVEQLAPGSVTRTTATLGRRVRGPLDVERLQRCVVALIERYETLRTRYVVDAGELRRVVSADTTPELVWRDFSTEPADRREAAALRFMDEDRERCFDLRDGPQVRLLIGRISPTDHLMLFATHHLAADASSLVLLEEELAGRYRGAAAGGDGEERAGEPVPYQRFIEWQDQRYGDGGGADLRYWTDLVSAADPLDLDTLLGPRLAPPPAAGYAMAVAPRRLESRQQLALDLELSQRVRALTERSRCSLYMVFLAALHLLLYLRSGGRSTLVRSPSANRTRPAHRRMIGSLESQIFTSCEVAPGERFTDLLARVRGQVVSALRHEGVPLSMLLGASLARGEAASQSPALAGGMVQFALFAGGRMASWPDGLQVSVCGGARVGAASELQVFVMEEGRRLDGPGPGIVLEANNPGGAYAPDTAPRFLRAFRDLLAAVAADPDVEISRLRDIVPAAGASPAPEPRPATGPGTAPERDLLERLLDTVRGALPDPSRAAHESLFDDPRHAVGTAVRLAGAVNGARLLERDVTVADLVEAPTAAALAARLAGRSPADALHLTGA